MNLLKIKSLEALPFEGAEAINQLRINLGFCGSNIKRIMITSTVPNEGKSFIALHLWKALADAGMKTLLVDCDLRNSEMRTRYGFSGLDKNSGIAHYLAGQTPLGEAICRTNVPNGYLLPATTSIANPMVLLEDELFEKMMADCSDVFEYIIVDTPPLASVADALKISTHCDGSLLVIRSDSVPRKMVINSARLLKKTGRPLLGTVLNRVDMGKRNNPYYRYYRYGEKYDYANSGVSSQE